ncbi:hypothetical protein ACFTXK_27115 [Streptomyces sp. NPDC056956]|uniref:hypothetical protein n=1 Tax=Streptomyces sp. NPDC056956 TaxID=3345980 RepID=UPI003630D141
MLGVMTALVLRASPRPVKRKIADRASGLVAGLDQRSDRDRLEESRSRTPGNRTWLRARRSGERDCEA